MTGKIDIGLHAKALRSRNADVTQSSRGASTAARLAGNVWLSVGSSFAGFRDADFAARRRV